MVFSEVLRRRQCRRRTELAEHAGGPGLSEPWLMCAYTPTALPSAYDSQTETETDGRFVGPTTRTPTAGLYADGNNRTPTNSNADGQTPTAAVGLCLRRRQGRLRRRLPAVGVLSVSCSDCLPGLTGDERGLLEPRWSQVDQPCPPPPRPHLLTSHLIFGA